MKYGFHAVLEDWQLSKLYGIFKKEKLSISPVTFSLPSYVSLNWEVVGSPNKSAGRDWGLYMPNTDFSENTAAYLNNKFVDVGTLSKYANKNQELKMSQYSIFRQHISRGQCNDCTYRIKRFR